jgi:hypothetical protein
MKKFLATNATSPKPLILVKFQDLPESIQESIHEDFIRNVDSSPDLSEEKKSLKEFARLMDVEFDYSFDQCGIYSKNVELDSYYADNEYLRHGQAEELTGSRLATWIINNYYDYVTAPKRYWKGKTGRVSNLKRTFGGCHMTGYYIDDILTETVEDYLKNCEGKYKHWNYLDVMEYALENWIRVCQKEYEYHYSVDFMIDCFDCWNTLFDENGERYDEIDLLGYELEDWK